MDEPVRRRRYRSLPSSLSSDSYTTPTLGHDISRPHHGVHDMKQQFRVLFICSANLCRSVTAAEYARRAALAHRSCSDDDCPIDWRIESAGTNASPGSGLPARISSTMMDLGIPRREAVVMVDETLARSADLILTAERHHRAAVARRFPFAVRYTFTLLQFAHLLDAGCTATGVSSVSNGRDLLRLAQVGRSSTQPIDDESIDISDPVEIGSEEAMVRSAELIRGAIDRILRRTCTTVVELTT